MGTVSKTTYSRRAVLHALLGLSFARVARPAGALTRTGRQAELERFPEASFVKTNGIRMAVHEAGLGLPLVFCHGFPELAFSWRHQVAALADAGFRALAPDQRGYGQTTRPESVEAYGIGELCKDLVGLLDARAIDRAIFCGHDWGGAVAWMMAILHPDRVLGVVGVNTPLQPPSPVPPTQLLARTLGEKNYVVAFQEPGVAEAILERNVRRTFQVLMRRGAMTREQFERLPADAPQRRFELLEALQLPDDAPLPGEPLLAAAELDYYVSAFERTGFGGGINWYRNIDRNWRQTKGKTYRIEKPCLYIGAEDDLVLAPALADGMESMIPGLQKYVIEDCGHWTQQEKPDELNLVLIEWLRQTFGSRRR